MQSRPLEAACTQEEAESSMWGSSIQWTGWADHRRSWNTYPPCLLPPPRFCL